MITQEHEKIAVDCLKAVLALIHEKRYKELNTVVDEIHYDRLGETLVLLSRLKTDGNNDTGGQFF